MTSQNPSGNGLSSYAFHAYDNVSKTIVEALKEEQQIRPNIDVKPTKDEKKLDLETTARRYLTQVLDSNAVPALTARISDGVDSDFKILKIETLQLTGTTFVKFRQMVHKIPVYGSLITVELDEANDLLAINSSVGAPIGLSPIADVSPADAIKTIASDPGYETDLSVVIPMLNYFYDSSTSEWRLVYILNDIYVSSENTSENKALITDFVIDAHSNSIVAKLPRTSYATMANGLDGLGVSQSFGVEKVGVSLSLKDSRLKIETYDVKFQNIFSLPGPLFGELIKDTMLSPPSFSPSAISAHANTKTVSEFLRNVLYRKNIDNAGGTIISNINCISAVPDGPDGKRWINAMWAINQGFYGQKMVNNKPLSVAASLDIVAHEIFHGVTSNTSRLEYRDESGALNESYSDIFGIIIRNLQTHGTDQKTWDWEIGKGLGSNGNPWRNLSDPTLHSHPEHLDHYKTLPKTEDFGGVHSNSGIHNKAAYNILISEDKYGNLLFSATDVAIIFYIALTQHLKETSQFADSRRAVLQSAQTFFKERTEIDRVSLIRAIETAFDNVGLSAYAVGDFAQGGIVFYVDKTGQHGLVCAKVDQSAGVRWGAASEPVQAKGDGVNAGKANTASIISSQVALGDVSSPYAAGICKEYNGGGYTDWYLPSKHELDLMYINKAIIITIATANGGTDFADYYFWSSTEILHYTAWVQSFVKGFLTTQTSSGKFYSCSVRAVRAF
jgi:Zn-dependent metalloprotease